MFSYINLSPSLIAAVKYTKNLRLKKVLAQVSKYRFASQ